MALLHFDGFDGYATTAQMAARYIGNAFSLSTTGGRFGGGALTSSGSMGKAISGAPSTVIQGAAFFIPSGNASLFYWFNAAGIQVQLYHNASSGTLECRNSANTVLGSCTYPTLSVWHHIEAKALIANSGGTFEVRVDGNVVMNLTGLDTQSQSTADVTNCTIGAPSSQTFIDDWYILDTTGSAPLNNFLGDTRVTTIRPTGDSSVAWTRSTGASNYLAVDDTTVDATDYVGSSTVGQRDVYDLTDLTGSPTVYAMAATAWALKSDAGTRGLKVGLRYSGNETQTSDTGLSTTTAPYTLGNQTAAPGSVAWTPTVVNATQLTLEVGS